LETLRLLKKKLLLITLFLAGVFGGLQLIGKSKGLSWTYLNRTVYPGTNKIVLSESVQWAIGDEIVITSTAFGQWQSEAFTITNIDLDQITLQLNDTLKYKHIGLYFARFCCKIN
jgi:hypothetical protein